MINWVRVQAALRDEAAALNELITLGGVQVYLDGQEIAKFLTDEWVIGLAKDGSLFMVRQYTWEEILLLSGVQRSPNWYNIVKPGVPLRGPKARVVRTKT